MKTTFKFFLMLLAVVLLVPQGMKAQNVDGLEANQTFDFQSYANQGLSIAFGDDYTGFSGNGPMYMKLSDGNDLAGRFATASRNGREWRLRTDRDPHGLWGYSNLAFCGMWNGDRVRITIAQGSIKFVEANSAKMNGSLVTEGQEATGTVVFAATKDGDVIISTNGSSNNYTVITKVEFFYSGNGNNSGYNVSFNTSSIDLEGGQTYDTNNANVSPSWATPVFTSSDESIATVDENGIVTALGRGTATITAKLDVGPEGADYSQHATAEMTVNVTSTVRLDKYSYDPAIEIYDLSGINTGNASLSDKKAGYKTSNQDAYIMENPTGYSLNNRLAVSINDFKWENGLKTTKGGNQYRVLSINDLKADDRVVITYSGNTILFGSHHTDATQFAAANNVYRDDNNNGERENNEPYIEAGNSVESGTVYTMEQDGHLDIRVPGGAIITKIEIYGDHEAMMDDEYNESAGGYTAYFTTTGQLMAKEHIVSGGLEVHIGNEEESQHAIVIMSDEGPVSYVYDDLHYLMARNADKTYGYNDAVPVSGTYYKFIPEVNGEMTVRLKATTVHYGNLYDSSTMQIVSGQCPYYLMVQSSNNFYSERVQNKNNGETVTFTQYVQEGEIYYIYGWWDSNNNNCGVAELIDVTFAPDNFVYPLAKCVENGTKHVELASISKKTHYCVKKKSDNIASCELSTTGNGNPVTLVADITYKEGADQGGVVLVKIGSPSNEDDPVFVLTIAYSAAFNADASGNSEGHTWDFSSKPLNGLTWTNTSSYADVTPYGTYYQDWFAGNTAENTSSLLYQEMHEAGPNGTIHSDWIFNYRVKKGETLFDPRFLNKYDMVGDNADMIWETEGLIFNTASNQSCIFNEYKSSSTNDIIDRSNTNQPDPDRYVGILPGGEFIIPQLQADDRVIIYMGSGNGSGMQTMHFNITNAYDAVHKEIVETDDYYAGGSQWNVHDTHHDPYYRGCYHFFAKGGDMKFKLVSGSMCKLYSIQIYRGERINTNGVQEASGGYTLLATEGESGETKSWNLHYRGKGETLAEGEVIANSTNIENPTITTDGNAISFTNPGAIGMLRVRAKCMEYNHNYVTDFADRNLTLAYHQLADQYPYTWDFTDIKSFSRAAVTGEYNNYNELTSTDEGYTYEPKGREISMWDVNGAMVLYCTDGDYYTNQNMIFENSKGIKGNQLYANGEVIPETKGLWFYFDNNDPAYNGCMRIAADGLHLANASYENNATCQPGETMRRGWWNYKMVVPAVPAGAAVYLRVKRDESVKEGPISFRPWSGSANNWIDVTEPFFYKKYRFDHMPVAHYSDTNKEVDIKFEIGEATTEYAAGMPSAVSDWTYDETYNQYSKYYEASDGSGDHIIAIYNWGAESDLTLTLNGFVLKKLAVATDAKTLNAKGWATESRARVIDPTLTSFMTGQDMRTYIVTGYDFPNKQVTLMRIDDDSEDESFGGYLVPVAADGDHNACIIRNYGGSPVSILDGGFHLFYPDMHDYNVETPANSLMKVWSAEKKIEPDIETGNETEVQAFNNLLVSQLSATTGSTKIPYMSGDYTNYAFTCKYYDINPETAEQLNTTVHTGDQAFYRIMKSGATSNGHQAYLPILVPKKPGSRAAVRAAAASESAPVSFSVVIKNRSSVLFDKGDVNGDGNFNKLDVNAMADHLAGRPAGVIKSLADMNGDGIIDIVDMTLMIQLLTNK